MLKSKGQIFTPDFIVKNMLEIVGYFGDKILNKHIVDNSCGDGAFLSEIVRRYLLACKNHDKNVIKTGLETFIHGIEIDEMQFAKCIKNLDKIASEFGIFNVKWDIYCADALNFTLFDGKMDFVVANPPYIRVHNLKNLDNIKQFEFSKSGMTDIFIVFYEIGLKMLNQSGKLCYITPSSIFYSIAAKSMRKFLVANNLIEKVIDLGHFVPFKATTYTAIILLAKQKISQNVQFFEYKDKDAKFVANLKPDEFFINDNFCFDTNENLHKIREILTHKKQSALSVKNGYATLCDSVFITDKNSKFNIFVIKASKGIRQKIFYPYDKNANLISEDEITKDSEIYEHLLSNKELLLRRSSDKKDEKFWYAYGRSQAINDTFKDKLALNLIIKNKGDLKLAFAPSGTGVYGGLYVTGGDLNAVFNALNSDEFVEYVKFLKRYKNGGYYTFSSKDVKKFLDYKLGDFNDK